MARNTNGRGFSLKDELFNEAKVNALGMRFSKAHAPFSCEQFVSQVMNVLPELELKQRIEAIADALESQLPSDFEKACEIIVAALPLPLDPKKTDDDFGDFIYAPLGTYVARHGATKESLSVALRTLREITMRFSMEDAIRTFLDAFPEETLGRMQEWAHDDNYHVRRLVSEGTRPLLPWSGRISLSQQQTLPLLGMLYADPTRYVTRSVANHLNDISKHDPDAVLTTLHKWEVENKQKKSELLWMRKHALRTLLREGNQGAMKLLGYQVPPPVELSEVHLMRKKVRVGEVLEFSFVIHALKDCNVMVDYVIDFQKANDKVAQKVYKIKTITMQAGDRVSIAKAHRFVAGATTLKFYPGKHKVTPQVNGQQFQGVHFTLTV